MTNEDQKEFDLEKHIQHQISGFSEQFPSPEIAVRTFDDIRHSVSLTEGEASTVMCPTPNGVIVHSGTVVPVGHVMAIAIDIDRLEKNKYAWISAASPMPVITDAFLKGMETFSAGAMEDIEQTVNDPVKAVQELAARGLLKFSTGEMEFDDEGRNAVAERLLDSTIYRMSTHEDFRDLYDAAAKDGITLGLITVVGDGRVKSTMIPMGMGMPIELAKIYYEEESNP